MRGLILALALASCTATPVLAQVAVSGDALPGSPAVVPVPGVGGRTIKAAAVVVVGPDGLSMPVSKQESFQLVTGNVPAAPVTLFGGDYILEQTCASYGTLTVQRMGPDGSTYLTLVSYSTSDTTSGHALAFGSYAKVRVTVSGTAGCSALLSRVPA